MCVCVRARAMGPDDVEEMYIQLIIQTWPAAMHLELLVNYFLAILSMRMNTIFLDPW